MPKLTDLSGQRFGRWVVIKRVENTGRRCITYECKCNCGNIKNVTANSLRRGTSQSCNCLNREIISHERERYPADKSGRTLVINDYRQRAKKKNIACNLSLDEFDKLFKGNCYYCGRPPSNKKNGYKIIYDYNGIDRLNNAIGYIFSNCVSCCKICNKMKSDLSYPIFKETIEKIYLNLLNLEG